MPPCSCRSKISTDYFSIEERPIGHYAAELITNGERWWLGTFEMADLAMRAYD
jgi:hypothetical protein